MSEKYETEHPLCPTKKKKGVRKYEAYLAYQERFNFLRLSPIKVKKIRPTLPLVKENK